MGCLVVLTRLPLSSSQEVLPRGTGLDDEEMEVTDEMRRGIETRSISPLKSAFTCPKSAS